MILGAEKLTLEDVKYDMSTQEIYHGRIQASRYNHLRPCTSISHENCHGDDKMIINLRNSRYSPSSSKLGTILGGRPELSAESRRIGLSL